MHITIVIIIIQPRNSNQN